MGRKVKTNYFDGLLLRESRETVVIAGPVFVHLLDLKMALLLFQLYDLYRIHAFERKRKIPPFDLVGLPVLLGRGLGFSEGLCNHIEH